MSDVSNAPGLIKKYPLPWHTAMGGDIKNFQGVWICNAGGMATEIAELANSCGKLADTLTALKEENERLREALAWYEEQTRLCRLIHSEGDKGRHALATDGGKRARAALTGKEGGDD